MNLLKLDLNKKEMESSLSKSELKKIKKLAQKKYRQIYKEYIADGIKVVYEALKANSEIKHIIISKNAKIEDKEISKIESLAQSKSISIITVDKKDFNYISTMENPEGIMAIIKIGDYNKSGVIILPAIYLDRINDPGNLGTIIRNAVWFGIPAVITSLESVDILNPKVVRASMGTIFFINYLQNINFNFFIKKYCNSGTKLFIADINGQDISEVNVVDNNYLLVLGSESHGISNEIKKYPHQKVTISLLGKGESLNVGTATGIILYEFSKKLGRRN